jgi:hypothetical protein
LWSIAGDNGCSELDFLNTFLKVCLCCEKIEQALQFWETGSKCNDQGTFNEKTWALAGNCAIHDAAAISKLSAAQWDFIMEDVDAEILTRVKPVSGVHTLKASSSSRLLVAEHAQVSLHPMTSLPGVPTFSSSTFLICLHSYSATLGSDEKSSGNDNPF